MGVDENGHHREGGDGSNEIEVRQYAKCDRCLTETICAMWENNLLEHDDGEVSTFSYLCLACLREITGALERYSARFLAHATAEMIGGSLGDQTLVTMEDELEIIMGPPPKDEAPDP